MGIDNFRKEGTFEIVASILGIKNSSLSKGVVKGGMEEGMIKGNGVDNKSFSIRAFSKVIVNFIGVIERVEFHLSSLFFDFIGE